MGFPGASNLIGQTEQPVVVARWRQIWTIGTAPSFSSSKNLLRWSLFSSVSYTTAVQIWISYMFHCTGRYQLNKLTSLPMCGFTAQLVEHRTGVAEFTGSNPDEAVIFSGFFLLFVKIGKFTAMITLHFDIGTSLRSWRVEYSTLKVPMTRVFLLSCSKDLSKWWRMAFILLW